MAANTHSQHLERWLGPEAVANLSQTMRGWYGRPIAVAGVPGRVYACGDGDFTGKINGGMFGSVVDYSADYLRRLAKGVRRGVRRMARNQATAYAGFSSLSDLIAEATVNGKMQQLMFQKTGVSPGSVGNATVHWTVGALPSAGGVGGASGTGAVCTSATVGAMPFTNPAGGDTTHVTTITVQANQVASLLLYDRLWDMTYNHATSLSTAVDAANRPTRYQTAALAPSNFISANITTTLSATAHNLTVTYVDDAGNSPEAATAYAAPINAAAGRTTTVAGQWFVPLNAGDTGARYITNIAQSTITSVTGVSSWFVGHPLTLIPIPIANVPFIYDGINSAFNLDRIYDSACLGLMTPSNATNAVITYNGLIRIVAG